MIKTGRFGQVMWSQSGSSPTNLISMKGWTLSLKTKPGSCVLGSSSSVPGDVDSVA